MSYLTERYETLRLPQLSYDHDEGEFHIGQEILDVDDELRDVNVVRLLWDQPCINDLDISPVCIGINFNPIGSPRFHEYLGGASEEVKSSTIGVIKSVFVTINPEIEVPSAENPGSFGFNMGITANSHANLYTFGECACLHPDPEGHWVGYQDWHEGYCEYAFHNNDVNTQTWSLLAGLGHLARLAAESGV